MATRAACRNHSPVVLPSFSYNPNLGHIARASYIQADQTRPDEGT
jgi:hypothetical protein